MSTIKCTKELSTTFKIYNSLPLLPPQNTITINPSNSITHHKVSRSTDLIKIQL
jgi:hypothetical protein